MGGCGEGKSDGDGDGGKPPCDNDGKSDGGTGRIWTACGQKLDGDLTTARTSRADQAERVKLHGRTRRTAWTLRTSALAPKADSAVSTSSGNSRTYWPLTSLPTTAAVIVAAAAAFAGPFAPSVSNAGLTTSPTPCPPPAPLPREKTECARLK